MKKLIFVLLAFMYYIIIGIDFGNTSSIVFIAIPLLIIVIAQVIKKYQKAETE